MTDLRIDAINTLLDIVENISDFDAVCKQKEYTDTEDVWNLLRETKRQVRWTILSLSGMES